MSSNKLGYIEAISVIAIATISNVLLNEAKSVFKNTGSGAILNILYVSILAFIIVFTIYKLFKNFKGLDILDISEFTGGKWLKIFTGFSFILLIFFYASIVLRDMGEYIQKIYFQNLNIAYILMLLILPAAIINMLDFKTAVKCNLIMVIVISIVSTVLYLALIPKFTYQRIFPILGNGANSIFITGVSLLSSFIGFAYLYFIMPLLKDYKDFKKVGFIATGLCIYSIILSVVGLLLIFPFVLPANESAPIYLLARQINFGTFIERADILLIVIWILTIFNNLSIALSFILYIFKKVTNIKDTKSISLCFSLILYALSLIYNDLIQLDTMENKIFVYAFFIIVFVLGLGVLILANIKHKIQKKKGVL